MSDAAELRLATPGAELSRGYYRDCGRPLLYERFGQYMDALTVGLVGEGSECFGFDDWLSMDHDYGPSFCIWLSDGLFDEIGGALSELYASLPQEYMGVRYAYRREQSAGRRGVIRTGDFYRKFLGTRTAPETPREWLAIPETYLAAATNGVLFHVPDTEFVRTREKLLAFYPEDVRRKIALFCNVEPSHVLQNLDAEILYQVPLMMEHEHLADVVCESLGLENRTPDLDQWREMCARWMHPEKSVEVALVGKYTKLHDAYISVVEALKHAGVAHRTDVRIRWVDSETVTPENVAEVLKGVSGVLVPGGFGSRGIDGMLCAIRYARENKIPYLGLCLGMQLAIVEFARDVLGLKDAHSIELMPDTMHPVIHLMPEQEGVLDLGGTLRLGSYPCKLAPGSKAHELYGADLIHERHRHRYEVNNDYRTALTDAGMSLCGLSPDGRIVEMLELPEHPFFLATQAHPEFNSRPNRPHPLFLGFVGAAVEKQEKTK